MNVAGLPQRLKRHGVLGALKLVPKNVLFAARNALSPNVRRRRAEGLEFDRTFGTKTQGVIPLGALGASLQQAHESQGYYAAVSHDRLRARLRRVPANVTGFTFIDYGAGMGRALLIASEYPFRRIVGVELLPMLADIAERNLKQYRNPWQRCFSIEIFRGDAREFSPPGGNTVYLFNNPFGPEVLRQVLKRIERCHAGSDQVFAIYEIPRCSGAFASSGSWETIAGEGDAWQLYRKEVTQPK